MEPATVALTRVTALVGDGLAPVDGTVVIEGGRVAAVGAVPVPAGAREVPLPGCTVLPGLVDTHVHLGAPDGRGPLALFGAVADHLRFQPGKRRAFLAHGVTTVCSLGDENTWVHDLRRRTADGTLAGPRVRIAGPLFTAPASPDQAREQVAALAGGEDPVDVVKVVQDRGDPARRTLEPIAPPVLAAITDEAHRHGVPVVAHWGTLPDLAELLEAEADHLQHLEPRGPLAGWPADLLAAMVERGVTLAPTLAVTEALLDADTARTLRRRVLEFHEAGGTVLAGSDTGMPAVRPGTGLVREIELLAACGLGPAEALAAATTGPARTLGAGAPLALGAPADLLAVRGDPRTDPGALRRTALVLRDGCPTARRRPRRGETP